MGQILSLLDMYTKCVEFFDNLGNPAKWYFIEKIANTIAQQEAYELLLKEEQEQKIKKQMKHEIKPIKKLDNVNHDPLRRPPPQAS